MSSPSADPRRAQPRGAGGEDAVAYLLCLRADSGAAKVLAFDRLTAGRERLETNLTDRARRQLGQAFVAEVRDLRHGADVSAVVVLRLLYPRGASDVSKLMAFAPTVERTVGAALGDLATQVEIEAVVDVVQPSPQPSGSTWDRVGPALIAVTTGIGVAGFVTVVGGAVEYGRFAGAGLPAAEAVSVVPTQTLITIGALTLMPALLFGLVYAAGLFLARELTTRGGPQAGRVQGETSTQRGLLLAAYLLVAEGLVTAWVSAPGTDDRWRFAGVVVSAVGLAGLAALVGRRTSRAHWLAATSFIAVAVFASGLKVVRAWDNKAVRAAAVVRESKIAMVGFYIAENSDRVYIGQLEFTHSRGQGPSNQNLDAVDPHGARIIAIDKKLVSDLAIGPPQTPRAAYDQATELADRLCERQPRISVTAAPGSPRAGQQCWTCPPGVVVQAVHQTSNPDTASAGRKSCGP